MNDCCVCLDTIEFCTANIKNWSCKHYNNLCLNCYNNIIVSNNKSCPLCRSSLLYNNVDNHIQNNLQNNNVDIYIENNLPDSIRNLTLSHEFNQPIILNHILNHIPNSITYLTFGHQFNRSIIYNNV